MCGIVGYTGPREAGPILLDGLRRLEYRGYDSAGIALVDNDGGLFVEKRAGKLSNLMAALGDSTPHAGIGLAHTRWATHGRPNDLNAHPHQDCSGTITVIHNGIIENFRELRDMLEAEGHRLTSETDTEAIAHLVEDAYAGDLAEAVRAALTRVDGAYALVVMHKGEPDRLVGARMNVTARRSSPATSRRSSSTRGEWSSSRRATSPTSDRGASRSPASTGHRASVS
jgi:glutamine---fructose-6-phosphate transaminase (isomerizing)